MIETAKVRTGTETGTPAADVAALSQAIQAVLSTLGDEVEAFLSDSTDELDGLRRPSGSSTALAVPAATAEAPDELPVIKVSTDAPTRHPALNYPPPSSIIEVDGTVRYTANTGRQPG